MGCTNSKVEASEDIPLEGQVHPLFNEADADLTLSSNDGVLFRVRRRDIASYSTGFVDPSIAAVHPVDSPIRVGEMAKILEILLQFMRNQQPPALDGLSFELLVDIAESAEKYKVHHSLEIFRVHIRKFVDQHPFSVMEYGISHGYHDIADEAAERTLESEHYNNRPHVQRRTLLAWLLWRDQWIQALAGLNTKPSDYHPIPSPLSKSKSSERDAGHPNSFVSSDAVFAVDGDLRALKDIGRRIDEIEITCPECLKARDEYKRKIEGMVRAIKPLSSFVGVGGL